MFELFTVFKAIEMFGNIENFKDGFNEGPSIPVTWIIMAFIISLGTAYIAYNCNEYEKPATRALSTIIAFFFSGIYLIYYFIVHVLFDRKCSSTGINNIIKRIKKN
jgi:uncharacterized membrane protein